jgi:hypothetical protein
VAAWVLCAGQDTHGIFPWSVFEEGLTGESGFTSGGMQRLVGWILLYWRLYRKKVLPFVGLN